MAILVTRFERIIKEMTILPSLTKSWVECTPSYLVMELLGGSFMVLQDLYKVFHWGFSLPPNNLLFLLDFHSFLLWPFVGQNSFNRVLAHTLTQKTHTIIKGQEVLGHFNKGIDYESKDTVDTVSVEVQ